MLVDRVGGRNQLLLESSRKEYQGQSNVVDAKLRRSQTTNQNTGCEPGNTNDPLIKKADQRIAIG